MGNARPLKGRASRSRAGHQSFSVSEEYLPISSKIQPQHHLIVLFRSLGGYYYTYEIPADIAGLRGHNIKHRHGMKLQAGVLGVDDYSIPQHRGKRGLGDPGRIDGQHEMLHRRIARRDGHKYIVGLEATDLQ